MPAPRKPQLSKLAKQRALLKALAEQGSSRSAADVATEAQQRFIDDPSRLKAALCTRRAGKTFGAAIFLIQECLANPGCTCIFASLTRSSSKRILEKDILRPLQEKFGITGTFNKAELSYTLNNGPNGGPGSVIYLVGVDSSDQEREKLLGQKYRLVVFDEAGSYRTDLDALVQDTIMSAADYQGTVVLIGTPRGRKGFFYRVTTGKVPGWSVHRWTYNDNPHLIDPKDGKNVVEKQRLQQVAANPLVVQTPKYRQNFLGEWTVDDTDLVYAYSPDRNFVSREEWEETKKKHKVWYHVLGIDYGLRAPSAWVCLAYSDHDPNVYVVDTYKQADLRSDQMAKVTQEQFLDQYSPMVATVIDPGGGGAGAAKDMEWHHGIQYEVPQKQGKPQHIELLNSDLITGQMKVVEGCDDLVAEWEDLSWDEREKEKGKFVVSKASDDHLSDACLYAYMRCRHFASTPAPKPGPKRDTDEWMKERWRRMQEAANADGHWLEREVETRELE